MAKQKSNSSDDSKVERIFFTFDETMEFLNVSHQTIYKLMEQGLPSHKIGKKRVFLKEDLVNWVKEH
jgi:excisionase family DNA binding protein